MESFPFNHRHEDSGNKLFGYYAVRLILDCASAGELNRSW